MTQNNLEDLKMQKRSRFLMILEWEEKRTKESLKHKKILDTLINRILQRVSISRGTNIAIAKFLRERASNSFSLAETLKTEIEYLPDPFSPKQNTLTIGLSAISKYQTQLCEKFIKFKEDIE